MFKLLGILVALYVAYAVATGQVYAKRGLWGSLCKRSERPLYYWAVGDGIQRAVGGADSGVLNSAREVEMRSLEDRPERSLPARVAASAGKWALVVGVVGFACGFFGPIALSPEANQGPLLGIFISGPGGALLGAILGAFAGLLLCRSVCKPPRWPSWQRQSRS